MAGWVRWGQGPSQTGTRGCHNTKPLFREVGFKSGALGDCNMGSRKIGKGKREVNRHRSSFSSITCRCAGMDSSAADGDCSFSKRCNELTGSLMRSQLWRNLPPLPISRPIFGSCFKMAIVSNFRLGTKDWRPCP